MKRRYNKEFKVKACELVLREGIKHAVVAEKMGNNAVMLYRWISEYQTLGENAFVGSGHLRPEDARLRMENEILKKAAHTLRNTRQTNRLCQGGAGEI